MVTSVSNQLFINQDMPEIPSDEELSSAKEMLEEAHQAHQAFNKSLAELSDHIGQLIHKVFIDLPFGPDSESQVSDKEFDGLTPNLEPLTQSEAEILDSLSESELSSESASESDLNLATAATKLHQSILDLGSSLDNVQQIVDVGTRTNAIGNSIVGDSVSQDPGTSSPISATQIMIYDKYF